MEFLNSYTEENLDKKTYEYRNGLYASVALEEMYEKQLRHEDISILDRFIEFEEVKGETVAGSFMYLLLKKDDNGEWHKWVKVVKLCKVYNVPKELREKKALMVSQDELLSAIWQKNINFITMYINMPGDDNEKNNNVKGFYYCYGVQVMEPIYEKTEYYTKNNTEEEKIVLTAKHLKQRAAAEMDGLVRLLRGNFRQAQFVPLNMKEAEAIRKTIENGTELQVIRGIPKTHISAASGVTTSMTGITTTPEGIEQNEEFIRAMLHDTYANIVMAFPIPHSELLQWSSNIARELGQYKSQYSGMISHNAGISIPMVFAGNLSATLGNTSGVTDTSGETLGVTNGNSDNYSHNVGNNQGVSHNLGFSQGQSTGMADSVSQAHSDTSSQGISNSQSLTDSHGVSHSISDGITDGVTDTHGVSKSHSVGSSDTYTEGKSVSNSLSRSVGQSYSVGETIGTTVGKTITDGTGTSHNITDGTGTSHSISNGTGISHSISAGTSASVSDGTSSGVSTSSTAGSNASTSHSTGTSQTHTDGTSSTHTNSSSSTNSTTDSTGTSHSDGGSHTATDSYSENRSRNESTNLGVSGGAEAVGIGGSYGKVKGSSYGDTVGNSDAWGTSTNDGTSTSQSRGSSVSSGSSDAFGTSHSDAFGTTDGNSWSSGTSQSLSHGTNSGINHSVGSGVSNSTSDGTSSNHSVSDGTSTNHSVSDGTSTNHSVANSQSLSNSTSKTHGTSESVSVGKTVGESYSHSRGTSVSDGISETTSQGISHAKSHSVSDGISDSRSTGKSTGITDTRAQGVSAGIGKTANQGLSQSLSDGRGVSKSISSGDSRGQGVSNSQSDSLSKSIGQSNAASNALGVGQGLNFSFGPTIGVSRSYQVFDEEKGNLIKLLEAQNVRLNLAVRMGAFYVDDYVISYNSSSRAGIALAARSSWGGDTEMSTVQVVDPDNFTANHLMRHASVFEPCTMKESIEGIAEGYLWSTIMLSSELAAFTHLPRVESGGPSTVATNIPPFSVFANKQGEIYLGKQINYEDGEPNYDYSFAKQEFMHTLICGASGCGKTTSAVRIAREVIEKYEDMKLFVLDWKNSWRVLKRFAPNGVDDFEFYGLDYSSIRPIRMNIYVPPKYINVNSWLDKVNESICLGFGFGNKMSSILNSAARILFVVHDVCKLNENEDQILNKDDIVAKNIYKITLDKVYKVILGFKNGKVPQDTDFQNGFETLPEETQGILTEKFKKLGNGMQDALDSILAKLEIFNNGELKQLYCCQDPEQCIRIEELIDGKRIVVLEGGDLDNSSKKFVIELISNGVFMYSKAKKNIERVVEKRFFILEEAHRIIDNPHNGNPSPLGVTEDIFQIIFNEGREFGIYAMPIVQAPSELPPAIVTNCSILVVHRLGNKDDIDLMTLDLCRNGRLDNRDIPIWLAKQPIGQAIVRVNNTVSHQDSEPALIQVARCATEPPTNEDLINFMNIPIPESISNKIMKSEYISDTDLQAIVDDHLAENKYDEMFLEKDHIELEIDEHMMR